MVTVVVLPSSKSALAYSKSRQLTHLATAVAMATRTTTLDLAESLMTGLRIISLTIAEVDM